MPNPERKRVFCPKINDDCVGRKCAAMKKKTEHWINEDCIGGKSAHSRDYFQCRHYEEVKIWLSDA